MRWPPDPAPHGTMHLHAAPVLARGASAMAPKSGLDFLKALLGKRFLRLPRPAFGPIVKRAPGIRPMGPGCYAATVQGSRCSRRVAGESAAKTTTYTKLLRCYGRSPHMCMCAHAPARAIPYPLFLCSSVALLSNSLKKKEEKVLQALLQTCYATLWPVAGRLKPLKSFDLGDF